MTPKAIIIHCSDTDNGKDVGGVREIDRWHRARGWDRVGYHVVISPGDRGVELGRGLNEIGAHCKGHNDTIGICMVGRDRFTMQQWESLKYQLDSLATSYHLGPEVIYGHYQFDRKKTCPNVSVQRILTWYLTGRWSAIESHIFKET